MIAIVLLACILAQATPGWTAEAVTGSVSALAIAGEITFPKTGSIRVELCEERSFKDEGPALQTLVLSPAAPELKSQRVRFLFGGVAPGRYAVRAFQDVNGNGTLDEGAFGPKEPWGTYRFSRPHFRAPRFDEAAFLLTASLASIQIELK